MEISLEIDGYKEEIKKHRRTLHQIPEIGFEEHKTAKYIVDALSELSHIEIESGVVGTGVLGYMHVSDTFPTIAFRSDMDALSLTEETGLEFESKHEKCMHGCGHDGHMATLLVFAKHMSVNYEKLKTNLLFIFQPAEEGPGGAEPMVEAGVLEKYNVQEIYGLHLYPSVEAGKLAVKPGPMMAKTAEFDIVINGKSGHGAMPHTAVDSIVIAADLVQRLQTIVSREVCPVDPAVLTVGRIDGGERRNIIAERVRIEGTMRAFTEDVFEVMTSGVTRHCKATESVYDCKVELDLRPMYAPVMNDEKLTQDFIEANGEAVESIAPQMTAEDFALFQKAVPGVFFFVGVRDEGSGHVFPLHNSHFNFNEDVLLNGVQAFTNILTYKSVLEI